MLAMPGPPQLSPWVCFFAGTAPDSKSRMGGRGAHLSLGNSPRVSPGSWVRALGVGIRGAKVAVPPTKTKWGAS